MTSIRFGTYSPRSHNPVKNVDPDESGAWTVKRQWNRSDVSGFAEYSRLKIQEFRNKGVKEDCADFAVRLIVGYASENGLPLVLKNRWGKEFDSSSDKYTNTKEYMNAAKLDIQAADLPLNSYDVEWSETQSGDFQVFQYTRHESVDKRFEHTAIFETIDKLVYGNFPASELEGIGSRFWTKGSKAKAKDDWSVLSGKNNSRWNVLNPTNMLPEPSIQKIEPKGIPQLNVDSALKTPERKIQ